MWASPLSTTIRSRIEASGLRIGDSSKPAPVVAGTHMF